MTSIAVEDVSEEPEGPRVEPAVSDVSIKELPDTGEEVGEPPAGSSSEPTIPEPAVAKAGPSTVKIRCPKCEKELLPKIFKYSPYCGGAKPARPSDARLREEDPILEPLEPASAPRVKAAPRAKSTRKQRQPPTSRPRDLICIRRRSAARVRLSTAQTQDADA